MKYNIEFKAVRHGRSVCDFEFSTLEEAKTFASRIETDFASADIPVTVAVIEPKFKAGDIVEAFYGGKWVKAEVEMTLALFGRYEYGFVGKDFISVERMVREAR